MIPAINREIRLKNQRYYIYSEEDIIFSEFEECCLEAFMQRTGLNHPISDTGDIKRGLVITHDGTMGREAYGLDINESRIQITASGEQGVIWALTTLYQLMDSQHRIPCGSFADAPKYEHRGLALDCVRHFFSIEEVYKIIEEMSLVKLNRLHWVLSNDQGYRIESKVFPKLSEKMGQEYYTQKEIKEIVAFAKTRGVEIIPEIDLPGHTTAILAAYPGLSCFGKEVEVAREGGIYPIVFCPGKEGTYEFVEQLLGEAAGLFPGEWFHIGGDEAPDWEWKECPCCQKKMREEGFEDTRQLQGYFSKRVKDMLAKHKKHAICWNDSLMASNFEWKPTEQKEFAQKTRIQYWSVQYAEKTIGYIEQGGSLIYSDMFELYLDYPSCMNSLKKVYECVPELCGTFYTSEHAQIAGVEGCLWTEHISDEKTLEERLFPRIYALGENAWSSRLDYGDFCERLVCCIEQARKRGIACQSLEEADPKGEAKSLGIREYLAAMQTGMSPEMHSLAVKFTQPNEEFQARFQKKFLQ